MQKMAFAIIIYGLLGIRTASAEMILDFNEGLRVLCPSIRPISSKKILVHFVLAEKAGEKLCGESDQAVLSAQCKGKVTCQDVLSIYHNLKQKYSGNIIGG